MTWNIESLKRELETRPEIKGWVIHEEEILRRERYFLREQDGRLGADQDREARQLQTVLRIFVRLPGRPGRQGEIRKKLSYHRPLIPQLEEAIESALKTDHQEWSLPDVPAGTLPAVITFDPAIAEDLDGVMRTLTEAIAVEAGRARGSEFNSSELFVSLHERTQHWSNGHVYRSKQTRVYAEAAYSHGGAEYLATRWSVSLRGMDLAELFRDAADRAGMGEATLPPPHGSYPVLVDSETLLAVFSAQLSRLSAVSIYNQLPSARPGEEWIPSAEGELLTMDLDPGFPFGADSAQLGSDCFPQRRVRLVEKNKVCATIADRQYAQYVGIPVGTSHGTIVVPPGGASREELLAACPRVLEILQFSALNVDESTGTFSSEIRLGLLHEGGRATPVKGGSLSASFNDAFRRLRFSSEMAQRTHFESGETCGQSYSGPQWALLGEASITG